MIVEFLTDATDRLAAVSDSPRLDAEILLGHALSWPRTRVYTHAEDSLPTPAVTAFQTLLQRRLDGEPVAYIIGEREFWSLPVEVGPDTLIPRPETELLVERALVRIQPGRRAEILDLGTGSGAVALALASERPDISILATDIETAALAVARRNAKRLNLDNIAFAAGDWFDAAPNRSFDVVVTNPPYVRDDDPHLDRNDVRHEPRIALTAGLSGFDAIHRIVADAAGYLVAHGWVLLEHGFDQAHQVGEILSQSGFTDVCSYPDAAGHLRVTEGRHA